MQVRPGEGSHSIFHEHKGRYGYRWVTLEMHNRGLGINHKVVQRLMGEMCLKSKVRQARYRSYKGEVGKVDDPGLKGLIHHSDRGCQYCSTRYVDTLVDRGMRVSMTQDGSPYDNAIAERVNGILKREWLDGIELDGLQEAREAVERVVNLYNTRRPHLSLGLNTPEAVYRKEKEGIPRVMYCETRFFPGVEFHPGKKNNGKNGNRF